MCRQPDYMLEGDDFLETFADYAIHYGDVALVLVDQVVEQQRYQEKILSALDKMGLIMVTASLPSDWPSLEGVKEFWAELDAEHEPNIIISLGSPSVIHFAKALSIIAPYRGHVRELFIGQGNSHLVLPHLTIPLGLYTNLEYELAISDTVSICDAGSEKIHFSNKELVPKMVGYDPIFQLVSIKQVS